MISGVGGSTDSNGGHLISFSFFSTGSHWLVVLLEPPSSFVCLIIYMPQNHGSANIFSEHFVKKEKAKM